MGLSLFRKLWLEDDGQDLIEYALLMAFLSLTAISLLNAMGTNVVRPLWQDITNNLTSTTSAVS